MRAGPVAPAKPSLMVTAVALRPVSFTVPRVAPVSSLTVKSAVPEAGDIGAGKICAAAMATAAIAIPVVLIMMAGVVAVSPALSVTLAVSEWLPLVTVVLFHMYV